MPGELDQDEFRRILIGEHPGLSDDPAPDARTSHRTRAASCARRPSAGRVGRCCRHFGFGRFPGNPAICQNCISGFRKKGMTGAEIPATLLFVDIRGSTALGERLTPTEFHDYLGALLPASGRRSILDHDGLVDKLVGDEVIGLFFGGVSGPGARRGRVIDAAIDLVTGRRGPTPPRRGRSWSAPPSIPATAYVGPTGPAGAGRRLHRPRRRRSTRRPGSPRPRRPASCSSARPRRRPPGTVAPDAERRTLEVRGREATIDVVVLRPAG